jgi:hypothetical protein
MAPPAARAEGKKREQHGHVVQCLRISVFFGQWSRQVGVGEDGQRR